MKLVFRQMNVNKSPKAFRTITETAEILDLPAHVLRFWESKFKYIKPMKRGGGRRYYRPEDIHLLLGIKQLLHSEGLTIKGAQKVIQTNGLKSIIKRGSEKVLKVNVSSELSKRQPISENKKTSLETFNISEVRLDQKVDIKELKGILENLQKIRSKIRHRCENKVVA